MPATMPTATSPRSCAADERPVGQRIERGWPVTVPRASLRTDGQADPGAWGPRVGFMRIHLEFCHRPVKTRRWFPEGLRGSYAAPVGQRRIPEGVTATPTVSTSPPSRHRHVRWAPRRAMKSRNSLDEWRTHSGMWFEPLRINLVQLERQRDGRDELATVRRRAIRAAGPGSSRSSVPQRTPRLASAGGHAPARSPSATRRAGTRRPPPGIGRASSGDRPGRPAAGGTT